MLPYLLFAYREVPRPPLDSLRLSYCMVGQCEDHWIFYLMHRKVPLVVVKVLFHILSMREKLSQMSELVHKNLANAQAKQKQWYNKSARSRKFSKGDQALILLPTDTNKLIAQWQGAYQVIEKIGDVNYLSD